jgi:hypothetical protein
MVKKLYIKKTLAKRFFDFVTCWHNSRKIRLNFTKMEKIMSTVNKKFQALKKSAITPSNVAKAFDITLPEAQNIFDASKSTPSSPANETAIKAILRFLGK